MSRYTEKGNRSFQTDLNCFGRERIYLMKENITVKDVIKFMRWKAKELEETWPAYFTKVDEKNLVNSNIDAKQFFEDIQYIVNEYGVFDLNDKDICPFCHMNYPECSYCEYGDMHGRCVLDETDEYTEFKSNNNDQSIVKYIGPEAIATYLIKKGLIEYEHTD